MGEVGEVWLCVVVVVVVCGRGGGGVCVGGGLVWCGGGGGGGVWCSAVEWWAQFRWPCCGTHSHSNLYPYPYRLPTLTPIDNPYPLPNPLLS